MKYKPSRDIILAVKETRSLSPSKISDWIKERRVIIKKGLKHQALVPHNTISKWLNRHPEIVKEIQETLIVEENKNQAVTEGLFENGAFYKVDSVNTWVMKMTIRNVKEATRSRWVSMLKRACLGNLARGIDIEDWGLKHPDNLTVDDALKFLFEIKKRNIASREWRLMFRNFFASQKIVVDEITGELESNAGQYSDLYVAKDKLFKILAIVRSMNEVAYYASLFSYLTATRITATLEAHVSYLNRDEHKLTVFEKSASRKAKKKVIIELPNVIWQYVKDKKDRIFDIEENALNGFIRIAMKEVIPDLEPRIKMPFHFWRHMHAQYALRLSDWNTALVAREGNWSTTALERYYGKADQKTVDRFASKIRGQMLEETNVDDFN